MSFSIICEPSDINLPFDSIFPQCFYVLVCHTSTYQWDIDSPNELGKKSEKSQGNF